MLQVVSAITASLAYLCIGLVRAWAATALPSMLDHQPPLPDLSDQLGQWIGGHS